MTREQYAPRCACEDAGTAPGDGGARRGITCDGLGKAIAEVWSALHRSRENWGCQGEHTSFWHDNQIGYERVNKGLFCLTFLI